MKNAMIINYEKSKGIAIEMIVYFTLIMGMIFIYICYRINMKKCVLLKFENNKLFYSFVYISFYITFSIFNANRDLFVIVYLFAIYNKNKKRKRRYNVGIA